MLRAAQSQRLRQRNYLLKRKSNLELENSQSKCPRTSAGICEVNSEFQTLATTSAAVISVEQSQVVINTEIFLGTDFFPAENDSIPSVNYISTNEASGNLEGNLDTVGVNINVSNGASSQLNAAAAIKKYAQKFHPPYAHIDGLLEALRPIHPYLPMSHKTLMQRNKQTKHEIESWPDGGEFVYFGMSEHLAKTINPKLHKTKKVRLQFNFDGMTMSKSGSRQFWPILGKVYTSDNAYEPFIIGIYSGTSKPKCVCRYLEKFVEELNDLLENGLSVENENESWSVEVMAIICDIPARAFIKCIKGHTGFHSCEHCTVEGFKEDGTTVFVVGQDPLRTDETFRNQSDPGHHHAESPLTRVKPSLNMINIFVLEFMHSCCLGTQKKLLTEYWMKPSKKILSRMEVLRLSQRLMNLSSQLPDEFQRATRSLGEVSKWKATEFRFFLLYGGMVVLKGILPDLYYKHYLLFSVACRILCSKKFFSVYLNEADAYLKKFVESASHECLYGLKILVNNVHNLYHLAKDCENMECSLSDVSAFCFENLLGKIRQILKSFNRPLAELCNKLNDYTDHHRPELPPQFKAYPSSKKNSGDWVSLKKLECNDCVFTAKEPNNTVMLKTGEIVKITSIIKHAKIDSLEKITLKGRELEITGPAFCEPCDASVLKIFEVKERNNSQEIEFTMNRVNCKMVCLKIFELPDDDAEIFVMPLLHMN